MWLAGDVFNVIGSVLQGVLPTMIALAIYYTLADIILLIQCLIYSGQHAAVDPKHLSPATPLLEATDLWDEDPEDVETLQGPSSSSAAAPKLGSKPKVTAFGSFMFNLMIVAGVCGTGVLGWFLSSGRQDKPAEGELQFDLLGQVFGWLCAVLYLGSRLPQILLNFERKSCDGISFLFFLFACLGNLTYVISILALDLSPRYLLVNSSWLVGSVGTLLLDGVIFIQFWVYNGVDEEEDDYDEDEDDRQSYENVENRTYQTI